ncbi:MAG: hypothetical protein HY286_12020 [Planctomycetes bacterium]|nr:hypothetical protein [Planctomycetota bacterium]
MSSILCAACAEAPASRSRDPFRIPGPTSRGATVLPNGWHLTPEGRQLEIADFPMAIDVDPQEKFAAIVFSGASEQGVAIVGLDDFEIKSKTKIRRAWLGGKFIDHGNRYLLSGAGDDVMHVYGVDRITGDLTKERDWNLRLPKEKESEFLGGFDTDSGDAHAYAVLQLSGRIVEIDLKTGLAGKSAAVAGYPYTCKVSRDNARIFVSLWGAGELLVLDKSDFHILARLGVGPHPNAICELPDGRVAVACANDNSVAVVDLDKYRVLERLQMSLAPQSPPGSTPNAVAMLGVDGDRPSFAVANADNNSVAIVQLSKKNDSPGDRDDDGNSLSQVEGFVPTGWYPTDVRYIKKTNSLLILSGKGLSSHANPDGPLSPMRAKNAKGQDGWVGSLMKGTLAMLPLPSGDGLAAMTLQTIHNSPYRADHAEHHHPGVDSSIPAKAGDSSPIEHVIYIIKENRTYDQVLGAEPRGNGDARLQLFGPDVAPNHHALAEKFVLLDNTYADAEVSAGGHQWSTGAYATDFTEKMWHTIYGPGGGHGYTFEGEGLAALVKPRGGYLWDLAARSNITYRSYGEFVVNPGKAGGPVTTTVPALQNHICPEYRGWDLAYKDVDRAKAYIGEFAEFKKSGTMPQLQIIRLPNDHTAGTAKGHPTPRAMVADNDLALGQIVETVSHSQFWKDTAIFVLEDDAQNGPDHVDAHRMIAFAISPYAKRKFTDSTLYSTSSFLRTIELILRMPPMSQFDAAAMPMWRSFTNRPDFETYTALTPEISINEMNVAGAYGQDRCAEFNLAVGDAAPEIELNEIIWKSIFGDQSEMPAPVRAAWTAWADYFTITSSGN